MLDHVQIVANISRRLPCARRPFPRTRSRRRAFSLGRLPSSVEMRSQRIHHQRHLALVLRRRAAPGREKRSRLPASAIAPRTASSLPRARSAQTCRLARQRPHRARSSHRFRVRARDADVTVDVRASTPIHTKHELKSSPSLSTPTASLAPPLPPGATRSDASSGRAAFSAVEITSSGTTGAYVVSRSASRSMRNKTEISRRLDAHERAPSHAPIEPIATSATPIARASSAARRRARRHRRSVRSSADWRRAPERGASGRQMVLAVGASARVAMASSTEPREDSRAQAPGTSERGRARPYPFCARTATPSSPPMRWIAAP